MVQSIGPKPLSSSGLAVASVNRVAAAAKAVSRGDELGAVPQLSGVAAEAAAQPPVDAARVAALRAQIANGSYRIDPGAVADRMIAMQQEWTSK